MSETSPNDANPLRRALGAPEHCVDCGEVDLLNVDGVCPSCATERVMDLEQHYREEA